MGLHTVTQRGRRVIVTLLTGEVITDKFVCRAESKRWIELERHGRIQRKDIKSFAALKGEVDLKRLGQE